MKLLISVIIILLLGLSTEAEARLICGWTQMRYFGIHDQRYKLARNWLNFPRTQAHAGAVVFQWRGGRSSDGRRGGHVARIVQVRSNCEALVADDKGTYVRNICGRGAVIVDPNGNYSRRHS